MSQMNRGPLATYNSLTDRHLAGFFANTSIRKHLRKAGLITPEGEIINDATYRLNMARRDHKKHVKDLLAQAIVHKTLDIERLRQIEIKRRLEEIAKLETVKRIREPVHRKFDKAILPYLFGDETQSVSQRNLTVQPSSRIVVTESKTDRKGKGESANLDELSTDALRDYAITMNYEQQGRKDYNPYTVPQIPLPPKQERMSIQTARVQRMRQRDEEKELKRRQRPAPTVGVEVYRAELPQIHMPIPQSYGVVVMRYHGYGLQLIREEIDPRQEIVIDQQHCGGNTRTVFKEMLLPGALFKFTSLRHRGYPFSLTLYIDGKVDCRVSTCCEFGHKPGSKLGHFSFVKIEGSSAEPCYRCKMGGKSPRSPTRVKSAEKEEVTVVRTQPPAPKMPSPIKA